MKLYKSLIGVFAASAVILFTGCTKKLDQSNPNSQTSATFWQTSDDALKGVNAAYGSLLIDGTYMRFTPALLDIRGDDVGRRSGFVVRSYDHRGVLLQSPRNRSFPEGSPWMLSRSTISCDESGPNTLRCRA